MRAGAEGPKSMFDNHLGLKFYALRTEKAFDRTCKVGYNARMKKNDESYKPSEDFALMDMLFMASWELGKANLTKSPDAALTLFKAAVKQGMDSDGVKALDALVKDGMRETDRLYAAEKKKTAEMN